MRMLITFRRKAKQQQKITSSVNGTTIRSCFALDELKPEDLKAFVYGNDPLNKLSRIGRYRKPF